jgi:EAL domain-containing protein (putative c-di-GMP-specific phosphodiesterase class I)
MLPVMLLRGRQNVIDHEQGELAKRRARIENLWLKRPALTAGVTLAAVRLSGQDCARGTFLKLIQEFGFKTAIDDFGVGYSGLNLLVEYQPTYIKLDRHMIGNIHQDSVKQHIFMGYRRSARGSPSILLLRGLRLPMNITG